MDWQHLAQRGNSWIWDADLRALPRARAAALQFLRVTVMVIADLAEGQLTLRAMSLVYTTLLSLVPLLAVSFSVLKGFGVHNQIEPLLLGFLEPLGEKGAEIAQHILSFVDNIKVGVLGFIGVLMLLYVVISLVQKVERAFNFIWRVQQPRRIAERLSDYFSVIVIGPVLIFAAMGITASVLGSSTVRDISSFAPLGQAIRTGARLLPYLLVLTAFTFVYVFMPNTRVRVRCALVGALVAALLWQSVGWAFAAFVVTSTRYTAIYSSFAILIMFMIWLYLAWLILLVGASVSFYYQHPEYLGLTRRDPRLSNRMRERLALLAGFLIAQHHYHGRSPWTTAALARRLAMPAGVVRGVLQALARAGLLLRTEGSAPGWVPARDLGRLEVRELLAAVRSQDEGGHLVPRRLPAEPCVDALLERLDRAVGEALGGRSLRDLVADAPPQAWTPPPDEAAEEPEISLTAEKRGERGAG